MSTHHNEDFKDIKFSVSMCTYKNDNPEHLNQAIDSIINQTVKPDEIVLVVDGPVPLMLEDVINKYESEGFIKVIRLEKNVGHGNARRIGLENCKHDLIAIMDADDISLPDRFEKQIRCFIEDSTLSIVGGNIKEFIETTDRIVGIRAVPQDDSEIKKFLKKRCPFNQQTVMFKASDVKAAGGYIDWYCNEDYYLWIRMYQNNAKFKNLRDVLVFVRVGDDMYSRRGGWKYFRSEARLQKYMLDHKIIGFIQYIFNVLIRFILQIMMPNKLRGFIFKKFARINHVK